jgi:hypothetical protein
VRLRDPATGQHGIVEGRTGWVRAVAFSPDGHQLASGGWEGLVRLWVTQACGKSRGPRLVQGSRQRRRKLIQLSGSDGILSHHMNDATDKTDELSERVQNARRGHLKLQEQLRAYRERRRRYDEQRGKAPATDGYRLRRGVRRDYRA